MCDLNLTGSIQEALILRLTVSKILTPFHVTLTTLQFRIVFEKKVIKIRNWIWQVLDRYCLRCKPWLPVRFLLAPAKEPSPPDLNVVISMSISRYFSSLVPSLDPLTQESRECHVSAY